MALGPQGARAKFYRGAETLEGAAPGGNWLQFPAFSLQIGATPTLQSDMLLSANARRNAADPYQGVARVEGTARVPLDTIHAAYWFWLMLGAPSTSGSSPNYTHIAKSGSALTASWAIEKALPDITRYERALGIRANGVEISAGPDGSAEMTISLLCLSETLAGSSGAGTPVITAFTRFYSTQGTIKRDGSSLAGITAATLRFSNGMAPVPTINSGLGIGGIDIGQATGGGSITARFADHTLETAARAATPCSITHTWTITANTLIELHYPRVTLEPTSAAIEGPTGISRTYNFIASDDTSDASLLRVTIKNQVPSY